MPVSAHGGLMAQTPQISQMAITTAEELIAATRNKKVTEINVSADLADLSPLRLMPGQTLRSVSDRQKVMSFRPDADASSLQPTIPSLISMSVFPRLIARIG